MMKNDDIQAVNGRGTRLLCLTSAYLKPKDSWQSYSM